MPEGPAGTETGSSRLTRRQEGILFKEDCEHTDAASFLAHQSRRVEVAAGVKVCRAETERMLTQSTGSQLGPRFAAEGNSGQEDGMVRGGNSLAIVLIAFANSWAALDFSKQPRAPA